MRRGTEPRSGSFWGAPEALKPNMSESDRPTTDGSRIRRCARRHVGEISVDAVEMVVEGSDVDQKVAEDVFGPLRKLQAFIL